MKKSLSQTNLYSLQCYFFLENSKQNVLLSTFSQAKVVNNIKMEYFLGICYFEFSQ